MLFDLLAALIQEAPSATPDLIAIYGTAGVPLLGACVAIRVLWKLIEKKDAQLAAKDQTIANLQADAVERADRMAPLLMDAVRVLEGERAPSPPVRTRARN